MIIDNNKWREIMINISDAVVSNENYLCELDSLVGDGDHGMTVSRGFKAVKKYLLENQTQNIYETTIQSSKQLSKTMGGAIGSIFQSIFYGMGGACKDCEYIDKEKLGEMLTKGLQAVKIIGGAKEGDRTLIDCLSPACDSYMFAISEGKDMLVAMEWAKNNGLSGCLKTKEMVARKGRAKFLGEKSIGYQDAGATTMSIILDSLYESIDKIDKEK